MAVDYNLVVQQLTISVQFSRKGLTAHVYFAVEKPWPNNASEESSINQGLMGATTIQPSCVVRQIFASYS